jgi:2-keto-3-deoxy-L-rhamnonate aldolase RhmA
MVENSPMRRANKVRAKLQKGECVIGTAIYSQSPAMVAAAGYSGIDFVRIDTEHTWRQDEGLENMINAAIIADVVAIVRVDRDNPYLVRKALEAGAEGVLIPNVTSVADAQSLVQAAKFPPYGTRGIGPLCLSGEWGRRERDEWVTWSNREPVLGVMIESIEAMAAIDDIMAVEGVDFASFGNSDYYMSLPSSMSEAEKHAQIDEGLLKTIAAAHRSGKFVLCAADLEGDDADKIRRLGADMISLSHDVVMVRSGLARRTAEFRAAWS